MKSVLWKIMIASGFMLLTTLWVLYWAVVGLAGRKVTIIEDPTVCYAITAFLFIGCYCSDRWVTKVLRNHAEQIKEVDSN